MRDGVDHVAGLVRAVSAAGSATGQVVTIDGAQDLSARFVVDATGWPPAFAATNAAEPRAWQTAFGVVLNEAPTGVLGVPTLMDFDVPEPVSDEEDQLAGIPTFCYSLPVHDGWLVEETVLAAATPIAPEELVPRLAARLGCSPDELLRHALRTESVRIPMGVSPPAWGGDVVGFGAAAGYIHPATGFSVAASLRAAPRVADALLLNHATTRSIRDAVWPRGQRRARILHDYGLDVLLRLDADEVAAFFDGFFDLPQARWASYLRIDVEPATVAAAMTAVFRSTSWPMRRRLIRGNPLVLARLLRP
jgi:lycopene beta-cyclase